MVRRTRRVTAFALLPASIISLTTALVVVPTEAQSPSGGNPVLGTWKLKSFVREVTATGEKFNQMGERPSGYISYSADGRMYAIATSHNRIKPGDADAADEERVKLHRTMFAYAGTYSLEGDKVTIMWTCHGTRIGREPM